MACRDRRSSMRPDCGRAARAPVMLQPQARAHFEGPGATVRDGVQARHLPPAKWTVGDRPPSIVGELVACRWLLRQRPKRRRPGGAVHRFAPHNNLTAGQERHQPNHPRQPPWTKLHDASDACASTVALVKKFCNANTLWPPESEPLPPYPGPRFGGLSDLPRFSSQNASGNVSVGAHGHYPIPSGQPVAAVQAQRDVTGRARDVAGSEPRLRMPPGVSIRESPRGREICGAVGPRGPYKRCTSPARSPGVANGPGACKAGSHEPA
jgi:hypothetical protein